jgi:hypothetical protein
MVVTCGTCDEHKKTQEQPSTALHHLVKSSTGARLSKTTQGAELTKVAIGKGWIESAPPINSKTKFEIL